MPMDIQAADENFDGSLSDQETQRMITRASKKTKNRITPSRIAIMQRKLRRIIQDDFDEHEGDYSSDFEGVGGGASRLSASAAAANPISRGVKRVIHERMANKHIRQLAAVGVVVTWGDVQEADKNGDGLLVTSEIRALTERGIARSSSSPGKATEESATEESAAAADEVPKSNQRQPSTRKQRGGTNSRSQKYAEIEEQMTGKLQEQFAADPQAGG